MFVRYLLYLVALLSGTSYSQELIFQTDDPANSVWPISGTNTEDRLSSSFAPRLLNGSYDYHRGIDIAEPDSTPVFSILPGKVVRVEPAQAEGESLARFGNFIVIAHDDLTMADNSTIERQTAYLHLSKFLVSVNDSVSAGDTIALSGNSGVGINTYHLHFEYYINRNNGNIKASDTRHPIRLLSYTPKTKNVSITRDAGGDSLRLIIKEHHSAIDLVRFELSTNTGITDTIDFEGRIGINGSSASTEDENPYDGVRINPAQFTSSTDTLEREFIFDNSVNSGNSWDNTDSVFVKIYTARDQTTDYTFDLNDPLPVELTEFNAELKNEHVILKWETATEVNNYGFEIERSSTLLAMSVNVTGNHDESQWLKIGFVHGHGNSNSPKQYEFIDINQFDDNSHPLKLQYRLKQIDTDGTSTYYSALAEINNGITYIENPSIDAPTEFSLSQNYPNPFNPSTIIEYSIPRLTEYYSVRQHIKLIVYEVLGNNVATLVSELYEPGFYKVEFDASSVSPLIPSGIYIYRLIAQQNSISKKMLILK